MQREFQPEELLPLSGLQHFIFCRRQWALIHLEAQWKENYFTASGRQLHKQVDDPLFYQKRRDLITSRSVPVASYSLGLSGICDLVEFSRSETGFSLPGHTGFFTATPVEYKRGEPKTGLEDEVQLAAQVICLEEMLSTRIKRAFLYYGKTRHRHAVNIDEGLRTSVIQAAAEMHALYQRQHTPRVRTSKACRACSLNEICLPELLNKNSVTAYLRAAIEEEEPY